MKLYKITTFKERNINIITVLISIVLSALLFLPISTAIEKNKQEKYTLEKALENELIREQNLIEANDISIPSIQLNEEINLRKENCILRYEKTINNRDVLRVNIQNEKTRKIKNLKLGETVLFNEGKLSFYVISNNIILKEKEDEYISNLSHGDLILKIEIPEILNGIKILNLVKF